MEDKAKCGGSLYWHNCYSGSHDLLTGNSMAHPAKMSPKLCFRILEHLEELGLASPEKDTILDPMAGTGLTAICAGAKGYKAVTVELEQKFIDMCQTYLCPGVVHYSVEERILPAVEAGRVTFATGGLDENGELEYKTYYTKALPERKRYVVTASSRCGNREWHPVHRVIGNKQYAERKLYKSLDWQILKGDSRQLSSLLTGNTLKSVTSPPYGDQVIKDGQRLASNPDIHWREWDRGTKYNLDNPDNIGNLKDTPLKSITSPPYQDSQGHPSLGSVNKDDWGKEGKDIVKRRGLSGEYGDTEGQVGNLKSITSPPYEESLPNGLNRKAAEQMVQAMYDKHGRTYSKEDFEYQVELILKRSNREYGETEGQIGKLKDKPLKSIVSPPYGEALSGGGIAQYGHYSDPELAKRIYSAENANPEERTNIEKQIERVKQGRAKMKRPDVFTSEGNKAAKGYFEGNYSRNPENIGNLKDTPLKAIVSPPYGGAMKTEKSGIDWSKDKGGRDKSKEPAYNAESNMPAATLRYSADPENIGNLKDTPLKAITSPPYGIDKTSGGLNTKPPRSGKDQTGRSPSSPSQAGAKEGYGETEGQIGVLKDTPLKAITSPPYGETGIGDWKTGRAEFQAWVINEIKTKGYVEWQGKRYNEAEWRAMNHGRIDGRTTRGVHKHPTDGYSDNPDNIGGLPDKPLKAITSPPYSDSKKGKIDADKFATHMENTDNWGDRHTEGRMKAIKSMSSGYSEDKENIGNLSDKPLKSIVSPPYGDTEKRDRSKESSNEKEKDYTRGDHNISAGYQGSDDNIGKLADKPFKSVMSPPYEGGGHHKGMLDSWGGENTPVSNKTKDDHGYGNTEGQIEKAESYLEAMKRVYSEIALVSDCLTIVLKNPTRNGCIRRLDLDTLAILKECGWEVHCQHRALLFEELEQADMFTGSKKQVKGRLSFFKRLSWQNGNPVASWEDVIICVRK